MPGATATSPQSVWSSQVRGVGHNEGVEGSQLDLLGIVRKAQVTHQTNTGNSSQALDGLLRELETATGETKVRRAYDQPDKGVMWGWEVAAYIMTKAISAGLGLIAALTFLLPQLDIGAEMLGGVSGSDQTWLAAVALLFLALTGGLLIKDLDRPDRFLYVLLRPQWNSWLVRGGYIITAYGGLLSVWLLNALIFDDNGLFGALAWPLGFVALATAVYTAFLFKQAKGRDFWQSPLLVPHMLVHAPLAGCAVLSLVGYAPKELFIACLIVNAAILIYEVCGKHKSKDAAETARSMESGKAGDIFRIYVILYGHILPMLWLLIPNLPLPMMAGVFVLIGMAVTEYLWVYLPQQRPNV